MSTAFTARRLKIYTLLFLLAAAAVMGLISQNRPQGWMAELFLSARAEASIPSGSLAVRLPEAMPADLAAVAVQPSTILVSDPDDARVVNAGLPFSRAAIEAARPFLLSSGASDSMRALECLTQAIYYEAGFEPVEGRRAVAQVVLNRMRHPAYPNSICGVVYQGSTAPGCQFSFTCDGALSRRPAAGAWSDAATIAREALAGHVFDGVGQATHYHTDYVAPYWAPKLAKITKIGAHIFYRWPGSWGRRGAFTSRYAGEPAPAITRLAAASLDDLGTGAAAALSAGPPERRAANDVGGRIDVSKGWKLSIPLPMETKGALSETMASQHKTSEAASLVATSPSSGGE